jgi:uncharacterized SAM-binding protein YcdF (DUF218 family)
MFYLISKALWRVAAPSNALILMTLATAIWALCGQSLADWLAVTGAAALVIGGFTPLSYWLMLPLENRFSPWKPVSHTVVDGLIVLGGDAGGHQIINLVELSREFPQARLVYSGPGEEREAEDLLAKFARLGGDRERITMETRSRNTFENAVYSAHLINPIPNQRWLLVTAACHMPRAIGCFRRVGFKVEAYPTDYTTRNISYVQIAFGLSSRTLSQLDRAMKEWIGLVVYRLTDKTTELFPAPWLAQPNKC